MTENDRLDGIERMHQLKREAFVKAFWESPDANICKIAAGIYAFECDVSEHGDYDSRKLTDRTAGYQHRVIVMATQMWATYREVKRYLEAK